MARADGRNLVMSWTAGIICTAVIGALLWLAMPMAPVFVDFIGETLRSVAPGSS